MAVLEIPQDPTGLAFLKFAISISSDWPLTKKVLRLEGPNVDQVEDVTVEQTLDLTRAAVDHDERVGLESQAWKLA